MVTESLFTLLEIASSIFTNEAMPCAHTKTSASYTIPRSAANSSADHGIVLRSTGIDLISHQIWKTTCPKQTRTSG